MEADASAERLMEGRRRSRLARFFSRVFRSCCTGNSCSALRTRPLLRRRGGAARIATRIVLDILSNLLASTENDDLLPCFVHLDEFLEEHEADIQLLYRALVYDVPSSNPLSKALMFIIVQSNPLLPPGQLRGIGKMIEDGIALQRNTSFSSSATHGATAPISAQQQTIVINALVLLSVLAEQHSGIQSHEYVTDELLASIERVLEGAASSRAEADPQLTLAAILAVEMLAKTARSKEMITSSRIPEHLHTLEKRYNRFSPSCIFLSTPSPEGMDTHARHDGDGNPAHNPQLPAHHQQQEQEEVVVVQQQRQRRKQSKKGQLSERLLWLQIGFCVRWVLDNRIPYAARSVELLDITTAHSTADVIADESNADAAEGSSDSSRPTAAINVILDPKDATKALKMSPDAIEVRADEDSFASVRATCGAAVGGLYYYEATLFTNGVIQLGWCTANCTYIDEEGRGIGDDEFSYAFDGCRKVYWHNGETVRVNLAWTAGSVVGCFLDHDAHSIWFSVNGRRQGPLPLPPMMRGETLYPAVSIMCQQHLMFNFGSRPYQFPPEDVSFKDLNGIGKLSMQQRFVIPKLIMLNNLKREMEDIDSDGEEEGSLCSICYNAPCQVRHEPCGHDQFCTVCSLQCEDQCPLCRQPIEGRVELAKEGEHGHG